MGRATDTRESKGSNLGEKGPLSQGVQARRKALRMRHTNDMEVRKKRPRGFKKEAQGGQVSPLNPLSVAPWLERDAVDEKHLGGNGVDLGALINFSSF
jgi:hypothetical protein